MFFQPNIKHVEAVPLLNTVWRSRPSNILIYKPDGKITTTMGSTVLEMSIVAVVDEVSIVIVLKTFLSDLESIKSMKDSRRNDLNAFLKGQST